MTKIENHPNFVVNGQSILVNEKFCIIVGFFSFQVLFTDDRMHLSFFILRILKFMYVSL